MKQFDDLVAASVPQGHNVLIVDSLNLAFRFKYTKQKDFREDYLRTIESLARSYSCGKIILLSDWGKSKFRREIYPDYKIDRVLKVAQQTEEDKREFEEFITDFNRALELCEEQYLVLKYKGVEADDIAAYICDNFVAPHIWLISSDKDWDLMVNEDISRFSYVTRKETTIDNWNERYTYDRENHISIKVLMGDKGDSIPGIKGVGIKRAVMLVNEYGSALDLRDQIPLSGTQKFIANVNQSAEKIILNYELMDLLTTYNEAIGYENIKEIKQRVTEYL